MRLFAIGDIHGCATALDTILAAISLRTGDRIVGLGDYINKGPESKAVIDRLIQLFDHGVLVPLLGNHELKLLAAAKQGQTQTPADVLVDQQTLASYAEPTQTGSLACIPEGHWRFVQDHCLNWLATENHIFVHANLKADQPLTAQPDTALFWEKFDQPQPHQSGKIMVCGHTPQRNGQPVNLGHAICLDTAACEGHWLTCLEVYSGGIWQANQHRDLKQSNIRDFYRKTASAPSAVTEASSQSGAEAGGGAATEELVLV
ncbi:MAG TPA: serine/threonine protein phosphatase [Leptolyngbyaceae cyanobacterium M65_K2018_010]|nr:serine/threonine protein phosphatase [Leptolyngbyaceae cyanobacterium M65_K2018_010]